MRDLFTHPGGAVQAFRAGWRAKCRHERNACGVGASPWLLPYPLKDESFALTPAGFTMGIGGGGSGVCSGPYIATVPYTVIRPYLTKWGLQLVAGVRSPRFERGK